MKTFLRNIAILIGIFVVLFILFSDIMKQIGLIYNGLGILPLILLMIIFTAVPKRSRRR